MKLGDKAALEKKLTEKMELEKKTAKAILENNIFDLRDIFEDLMKRIEELAAENATLTVRACAAEEHEKTLVNRVLDLEGDKAELAKNRESLEYVISIYKKRINDALKALTE